MRILLFVLTSVFTTVALSAQPIAGVVSYEKNQLYITGDAFCSRYSLTAQTFEAFAHLKKLSVGDEITATGDKNLVDCSVSIASIDYVGLRRLLGMWLSSEALIKVKDFKTLSFYPLDHSPTGTMGVTAISPYPVDYVYSLTPSEGKEWVLFLSDSKKTLFATISVSKGSAIMRIYDSENGTVIKTLRLTKWGGVSK